MAVKIAIDFGSEFITIYHRGEGVILKEPSLVIISGSRKKTELVATGTRAVKMLGRLDAGMNAVYPIRGGAVANVEACTLMLKDYVDKVAGAAMIKRRVEAVTLVSCGLTSAERSDIEGVVTKAGVSETVLAETPIAVFQLGKKDRALVMIIGSDLTELAIVTDDGVITGCSLDIAGSAFNKAISDYIALKYRVQIGAYAAEKVKLASGSMFENDMSVYTINGKDLIENAPRSIEITASDVRKAITPLLDKLLEVIDTVMCACPDNIIEEVYENGIFLAGGSASIPGLSEYISVNCRMKVSVLPDPINAVAQGGGELINEPETLNRLMKRE